MLAWDVAGDVGDVAIVVYDLVDLAVVIGGNGALVSLWPSVGAGVGALHISTRHSACSKLDHATFSLVHGTTALYQSAGMHAAGMALT